LAHFNNVESISIRQTHLSCCLEFNLWKFGQSSLHGKSIAKLNETIIALDTKFAQLSIVKAKHTTVGIPGVLGKTLAFFLTDRR
jgi:hypothetical protein